MREAITVRTIRYQLGGVVMGVEQFSGNGIEHTPNQVVIDGHLYSPIQYHIESAEPDVLQGELWPVYDHGAQAKGSSVEKGGAKG